MIIPSRVHLSRPAALLTLLALVPACNRSRAAAPGPSKASAFEKGGASRGTTSDAPEGEDGQWPMVAKDYANRRFSGLDAVHRGNVGDLKLAWKFSTGIDKGHEAAPLVVGKTLYLVTPFPNHVYAFDLTRPGAPPRWAYEPDPVPAAQGVACCDVVNRGPAFSDGRLVFNTLDGRVIAVDAESGRPVWETPLGDINLGETITMAPLVVKGRVLVGNSGGEFGVRGWLSALDLRDGRLLWRAYSTGPDADCLIGPAFRPFYAQDKGKDLGVASWPPGRWEQGGGTVWGFLSYDPVLDLVYHGTANPGPWNPDMRPGDNKWTAGIFARRPETGEAIWFYQWSPHDLYDHDGVNENVLVDVTIGGQRRRVLAHAERNGYFYLLDRATGEVLSAEPFAHVNASEGVDLKTGRLVHVAEKKPVLGRVVRDVCPASPGAKDWQPMAYSPRTGLVYIPHNNLCQDVEATEASYIAGTPYVGMNVRYRAGPGGHRGELTAWDPARARRIWSVREEFPAWSGALATAGGLVFYGTMQGTFKALDAETGQLLWKYETGSGIVGQPISFRGPDGRQYVAVLSGVGGWPGSVVTAELDTRDPSAGNGWGATMMELPKKTGKGGTLHVFGLP